MMTVTTSPATAPAPSTNPVPKRISSQPYTSSIGVMVLRHFRPALADDVEAICEQITATIDRACERVMN